MKKILLIFGTRPEAVKMCPLVLELQGRAGVEAAVCLTGQHQHMPDAVMEAFGLQARCRLDALRPGQSLTQLTARMLTALEGVLDRERPDLVLVHGDTATAFSAALACFHRHIPVGHVEAGLRTYDLDAPFPEELHRQAVGLVARYHFAPTRRSAQALLREGKDPRHIYVTGNTVIDALRTTVRPDFRHPELDWAAGSRLILLTAHRRENLGAPMRRVFRAMARIAEEFSDVKILFPVHPNPAVIQAAVEELGSLDRVHLVPPLDMADLHNILARCHLVVTDSGGLQEEAPSLAVPVLVTRERTERPEGVQAGVVCLAGTREDGVLAQCRRLLSDPAAHAAMARAANPYGDGTACRRIADILLNEIR